MADLSYIKQLRADKAEALASARSIETENNDLISYLCCDKFLKSNAPPGLNRDSRYWLTATEGGTPVDSDSVRPKPRNACYDDRIEEILWPNWRCSKTNQEKEQMTQPQEEFIDSKSSNTKQTRTTGRKETD